MITFNLSITNILILILIAVTTAIATIVNVSFIDFIVISIGFTLNALVTLIFIITIAIIEYS